MLSPADRLDRLDALRGAAVVWMAVFHFCFDLNHFGFIRQNFYVDPLWTGQRLGIVTLFLTCVGVGQAIAVDRHQRWPRFWRRWLQIAGCALLASAGSWLMFPRSFISFGVLHCVALGTLMLRLTAPWGRGLWLTGALALLALLAPRFIADPWFDGRATNWIGLVTAKPIAEDYVPLLPWIGVMWWGLAAGRWVLAHRPHWMAAPVPTAVRPLATLGRWSLSFYMVHQPVLIGVLGAVVWWRGR